jgi:hypothetical protein
MIRVAKEGLSHPQAPAVLTQLPASRARVLGKQGLYLKAAAVEMLTRFWSSAEHTAFITA